MRSCCARLLAAAEERYGAVHVLVNNAGTTEFIPHTDLDAVTPENLLQTLRITDAAERARLGRAPRIGVSGLNPHAGEGGLFGAEDDQVVAPCIQAFARTHSKHCVISGPLPADTLFAKNFADLVTFQPRLWLQQ